MSPHLCRTPHLTFQYPYWFHYRRGTTYLCTSVYQNCSYKSHAVNEMSIKLVNRLSIKTVEVTQHLSMHVNIRNIHAGSKTSSALTIWLCVFSVPAWALSVPIQKMHPDATSCLHGYKLTVIWVSPPTPMWTRWQFLETYSGTSDGSGWRKAVVNWCLKVWSWKRMPLTAEATVIHFTRELDTKHHVLSLRLRAEGITVSPVMCITLSLRLKEGRGHYSLTCNVYHPKSKAEGGQGALLSQLRCVSPES